MFLFFNISVLLYIYFARYFGRDFIANFFIGIFIINVFVANTNSLDFRGV